LSELLQIEKSVYVDVVAKQEMVSKRRVLEQQLTAQKEKEVRLQALFSQLRDKI